MPTESAPVDHGSAPLAHESAPLAHTRTGSGPRVVLVHGFTQTARCWGPILTDLARDHEVVAVDAPGHGRSADVRADLVHGAELLAEVGGPAVYVGYSMGARLALHVALQRPDVVSGLVLIGATGGLDTGAERAQRRAADEALARHLEAVGVDAFLDEWLSQPLFAGLPDDMRMVEERRTNTVAGLCSSLRSAGTGTQAPLWDRLTTVRIPTLVVTGALDPKFSALGSRLTAAIGESATLVGIEGAGHTTHLERPDRFLAELRTWSAGTARPA